MKRHREIAASPKRTSTECWAAIGDLIASSLERSDQVSRTSVEETLAAAAGVGRQLVAGGHLDRPEHPITVIAADLHLCLNTVSGARALSLEENLSFVAGAASAAEWMIYLPTPDPLGGVIEALAAGDGHLCAEAPAEADAARPARSAEPALDLAALEKWAGEKR